MKEMFLCSDRLDKYQSLGENGQAVHLSALQLRETLRLRRQSAVADCLAIPQVNEHGDRIDWYAPFSGDVVPWSAAMESERAAALSQLESHQAVLSQFSEEMREHKQPEQRLFGQLLEKALQFPDPKHVWLVAGKPVISFWGFVNARHQARIDPLDCLRPAVPLTPAAPVTAAPSPSPAPEPVGQPPVRRGWWWVLPAWLRWLLPLLLLLLLILLFLRSCVPGVSIPGLSALQPTLPNTTVTVPQIGLNGSPVNEANVGNLTTSGNGATVEVPTVQEPGLAVVPESQQETPAAPQASTDEPSGLPTPENESPAVVPPVPEAAPAEGANAQPEPIAPVEPGVGNVTPPTPAGGQAAPLTIPAEALAQGNTDFLNGRWHAGAGIQDRRTGKPLSLSYQLNNGQGEVRMTRGDGVACRGAVNAAIQAGQLAINNQGEATCSDGSVYKMPEILCVPGAQSAADCKGLYDENTLFPISMKQEAGN